jgi:uncharacterized DUF497 family protein
MRLMVTYDETKRRINLARHGLDLAKCDALFDGPVFSWEDKRMAYGEQRINVLGFLEGVVVHLTYTERDGNMHAISLRKAEKHEIRYFAQRLSR